MSSLKNEAPAIAFATNTLLAALLACLRQKGFLSTTEVIEIVEQSLLMLETLETPAPEVDRPTYRIAREVLEEIRLKFGR